MNRKDIKVILTIRAYTNSVNTYTNSDEIYYLPFKSEVKMDKHLKNIEINRNISDKTYVKMKDGAVTLVYMSIPLNTFKNYLEGLSPEAIEIGKKYYWECSEEKDRVDGLKKKEAGFVNYKYPMNRKEIKGNLTFLLTPDVMDYIGDGSAVWGYLGHSHRQLYMDEYIEFTIKRVSKFLVDRGIQTDVVSVVARWISSSFARHWMDSREGDNRNEFKRAFKDLYIRLLTELELSPNIIEAVRKNLK